MKRSNLIGLAGWLGLSVVWTVNAEPEPAGNRLRYVEDRAEGVTLTEAGAVRVIHRGEGKATFPIATVQAPVIGQPMYVVAGKVRYKGVEGVGYLEMWNHFGSDQAYFSRTLGDAGPTRSITADSEWRDFILPFNKGEEADPSKLAINLVLEGPGEVEVKDLSLVVGGNWRAVLYPDPWWGGMSSGVLGASLGILFGVLGTLIGWARRDARRYGVAMAGSCIMVGVGGVSLVAAGVALVAGQPSHVTYLLLLAAVIGIVVGGAVLREVRALRTQGELRRMDAADAGVS